MKRKSERDINLLFFEYKAYYDENDKYIVKWSIDWFWTFIITVIAFSVLGVGG